MRSFALLVAVPLSCGCGRLSFDRLGVDAGAGSLGAFGTRVHVSELDSADAEFDPTLPEDQLEIYFGSLRGGGQGSADIWRSTRPSTTVQWSTPTPVVELNSIASDLDPEITRDGLTMALASSRGGAGNDLYLATRPDRASAWSTPVLIAELANPADDPGPSLREDLLELYFHSDRASAPFDIYRSSRPSELVPWGAPTAVVELNSTSTDGDPKIVAGGLVIVFNSTRPGGGGGFELWQATRASVGAPFDPPTLVPGISSPADETAPWISEDLRTIYFVSDQGVGDRAIFYATR